MRAIGPDHPVLTAAGAVKGGTWEISQLVNGVLYVERTILPFDTGSIGSVTVDRVALHQVSADAGFGLVLTPASDSGAAFVDGRRLIAGDAVILPPSGDLELLTHGMARVYFIAFRTANAGSRLRVCKPRWHSRADRAGSLPEDVGAWIAAASAGGAESSRAATIHSRLLMWLRTATLEAPQPELGGLALPRRRMAVERVRRFIHEHLTESMTLADLCHQAHLQARSLEYGFRDLVGLSPFKYIKMLRLGEVRRRLQSSNPTDSSVSQVALDCGFNHLSQFAADYKRAFLESPSETARAVDRQRTRVARYDAVPAAAAAR